jgi:hypothetical protein
VTGTALCQHPAAEFLLQLLVAGILSRAGTDHLIQGTGKTNSAGENGPIWITSLNLIQQCEGMCADID